MAGNRRLGLAFALTTVLMWGLLPLALQAVLAVMDPLTITWYRFSLSALIALVWYGLRSGPALRAMLAPASRGWTALACTGLVGNYLLFVWGLERTNPGATQILVQLAPLMLLLLSVVLLGERMVAAQWAGVGGFTLGLLLFFRRRLSDTVPTDADYLLGLAFLVGAALVWTAYGLAQKKLLGYHHAKDILLMICLAGSVMLLPFAEPAQILALDAPALALLFFCGLNTTVAYGAFGMALSHWDASRVSAVIPLVPLLTLAFTALFNAALDARIPAEPLDWTGWLGAMLVVAGSATVALVRGEAAD